MRCSPYRPTRACAAGPVAGSGPGPRRTLPTLRVVRFAHSTWWGPGAPAARAQPARRRHPLPGSCSSWLDHGFVATRPHGFADPLGTPFFLYMDAVVVGELAHRRAEDRR